MTLRTRTALAFLTSGLALLFITLFAIFNELEPFLRGGDPTSAALRPMLEAIYPFPMANDIRAAYGAICLIPVLAPVLSGHRLAAWITLAIGLLTALLNVEDAFSAHLFKGQILFGSAFLISVGAPAVIGLAMAWRWGRGRDSL